MQTLPAVLGGLLLVVAIVPSATAERLPIRTYTTEQGLAHAHVRRIVRDPRGLLWFCTVDGLSRFDGAEFVTYRTDDGLPDPRVNDLLVTRDGTYWIATNGGVARFDPLEPRVAQGHQHASERRTLPLFKSVPLEGPQSQLEMRALIEDRAGHVWAGGLGGLFMLDGHAAPGRFRRVVPGPEQMVTSLAEDSDGTLWIGTFGGLFLRQPSGRVLREPTAERVAVTRVRALAFDLEERLWVGHDAGLLVLGRGTASQFPSSGARHAIDCTDGLAHDRRLRLPTDAHEACVVTIADGLIDRRVRAIRVRSDGHVWVGTVTGLSEIAGDRITSITETQGLADDTINALAEDLEGNLWIGTDAGGAMRVMADGLVSYFKADGLAVDYVPFLIEGNAGSVIAVSGNYFSIGEFDGHRFVPARFNVPRSVPDDGFFCVLRDHLGAWWLGTPKGLYEFPAVQSVTDLSRVAPVAHYAQIPGVGSDDLFPLFEDTRGDIWLMAQLPDRVALLRWHRATGTFQTYGLTDGLAGSTTRPTVIEDQRGEILVGFEDAGLFAYREGRFQHVRNGGNSFGVVDLHLDRAGRLWIVDVDGSVGRIDDLAAPRIVRDPAVDRSLIGTHVRCVVEDARGHVFFGTTHGIVELDPSTGNSWRYTTAEGLAQNEVRSAFVARSGDVWFGTIAGVSRLATTGRRSPTPAPEVFVTAVRVNAETRGGSELGKRTVPRLTLSPEERQVAVDYFGISFSPGERLRYQYRLEGSDGDWSPPTAIRTANYANLSPGTYRFLVRALTLSGATSATPAAVSFRILPPLWRRWWFVAGVWALVIGLAALLHHYRVAQLLAVERVRTRIATDLHDDIGASLSQIAILSELVRGEADTRQESANTLGRIATISRELIESMGDIVWAINPKRDRVGDLLQRMRHFASDTLTGKDVNITFPSPGLARELPLGADVRREILLIFKEAVNNIVRHAGCHHVDIEVEIERDRLVLRVADDGEGISSTQAQESGHGLLSMRERATRMHGSLDVDSGPGRGTTLVLRMPLRRTSHTYLST
jgi:signal transduction histidine kinase/ligand-binding sensor domain-containing protein